MSVVFGSSSSAGFRLRSLGARVTEGTAVVAATETARLQKRVAKQVVAGGSVDQAKLESALNETLDCIIIDYQPAPTLFQLNNVMASTSLILDEGTSR